MKLDAIAYRERRARARFALRLILLLALSAALACTGSLRAGTAKTATHEDRIETATILHTQMK